MVIGIGVTLPCVEAAEVDRPAVDEDEDAPSGRSVVSMRDRRPAPEVEEDRTAEDPRTREDDDVNEEVSEDSREDDISVVIVVEQEEEEEEVVETAEAPHVEMVEEEDERFFCVVTLSV